MKFLARALPGALSPGGGSGPGAEGPEEKGADPVDASTRKFEESKRRSESMREPGNPRKEWNASGDWADIPGWLIPCGVALAPGTG